MHSPHRDQAGPEGPEDPWHSRLYPLCRLFRLSDLYLKKKKKNECVSVSPRNFVTLYFDTPRRGDLCARKVD